MSGESATRQRRLRLPRPGWSRLLEDWERTVAIAIGVVTLAAALLTYLAVLQDDAASEARGQATLETLKLQRQRLVASVRVDAEAGAADRYRRALAEAEALEESARSEQEAGHVPRAKRLRAEALQLRFVADAHRGTTFDSTRMTGTDATATYDVPRRRATILGYEAFDSLQPEQPEVTAAAADARHAQSVRTMLAVVLLLVVVVLLTLGRIVHARWRTTVLATAAAGFSVAVLGSAVNAVVGG